MISSVHSEQANESSSQNDSLNIQLQRLKGDQEGHFIKNKNNKKQNNDNNNRYKNKVENYNMEFDHNFKNEINSKNESNLEFSPKNILYNN